MREKIVDLRGGVRVDSEQDVTQIREWVDIVLPKTFSTRERGVRRGGRCRGRGQRPGGRTGDVVATSTSPQRF